jgi:hypothetical protein
VRSAPPVRATSSAHILIVNAIREQPLSAPPVTINLANSEAYRWRATAVEPACHLVGIELLSDIGLHATVFGLGCTFAAPLVLSALVAAVRRAWVVLCFATPALLP